MKFPSFGRELDFDHVRNQAMLVAQKLVAFSPRPRSPANPGNADGLNRHQRCQLHLNCGPPAFVQLSNFCAPGRSEISYTPFLNVQCHAIVTESIPRVKAVRTRGLSL